MTLEEIARQVGNCRKCPLHKGRTNPVPGDGNPKARIMFIGEAPGYWEDQKGKPFVGKAGKILDELLQLIGLDREDTFIGNILKCRPPDNRDPEPQEIKLCTPFLDLQLEAINPSVIATLGNFSTSYILKKFGFQAEPISRIHGKVFRKAEGLFNNFLVIPIYHPAAATYNPKMKEALREDFKVLRQNI